MGRRPAVQCAAFLRRAAHILERPDGGDGGSVKIGEDIVCVTGGSGFVGSHIVDRLLARGHRVRATVRDPDNADKTTHLKAMAERHPGTLELHRADLLELGSFDGVIDGCFGVIHTAAVARFSAKDPQAEIVAPSVDGVNNVLSAVRKAGSVRRIVHTSSAAAVYSQPKRGKVYTESDWNDEATVKSDPYGLAKTRAERSVWSFVEALDDVAAVSINPVLVLGQAFTAAHVRTSLSVFRDILVGTFPAVPRLWFNLVDVRDVADAHITALEDPRIEGRFILSHQGMWMRDIARHVARLYPRYRIKTGQLPNIAMYLAALFDARVNLATMRQLLGRDAPIDNRRSRETLGIDYADLDETLRMTADTMVERGFARPKSA